MGHYVIKVARNAGIVALFVVAAMLGILSGVLFAYAGDLPQVSALDNYSPSTITRVYAADGQIDRRICDAAPRHRRLRRHQSAAAPGDHRDRGRANSIATSASTSGGSRSAAAHRHHRTPAARRVPARSRSSWRATSRSSSASRWRNRFERKIREAILAIQIEKRYTKREIFTIYCNQMYLGHGAYGVEAASRLFFNKSNKQLTLEEAALIAGIFQTPERQSPFVDMKRATRSPQRRAAADGGRALSSRRRKPTRRKPSRL